MPIILHHHERFAGHGYPYGLRANEIPLGARIVAIADAYDAMTHDRPYKRAMSHDAAIVELRQHAGTQFDPELVALFCDLYTDQCPDTRPDRPGDHEPGSRARSSDGSDGRARAEGSSDDDGGDDGARAGRSRRHRSDVDRAAKGRGRRPTSTAIAAS